MFNPENFRLSESDLAEALSGMILSPSGWRGVFSAGGTEEDRSGELSKAHALICAAGAAVFADFLRSRNPSPGTPPGKPLVILGRDTRPTGEAVADIMLRALLASGCRAEYTGIAAAPEIMAYAAFKGRKTPQLQNTGFCYISASHNPIGHNGLKFGLDDGGVLEGREALQCIERLKTYLSDSQAVTKILTLISKTDEDELKRIYAESGSIKQEALTTYRDFSSLVINGSPDSGIMEAIRAGLEEKPLGIAVDFNGSARTVSIDEELLRSLWLGYHAMNAKPGEIAHAIIPEGDSLEPCRLFLEDLHGRDPSTVLSYVPDCDGDRGNLVIWDENAGKARSLEAQEVFALACVSELAHLVWTGELRYDASGKPLSKAAVAVNGPTSMRIDRIAEAFGVEVFRAEVGEANVVNLARKLRKEDYVVRILGEGSNGGNITHPSAVRDPIATVFGLIKLLTIRKSSRPDGLGDRGFFEIWLKRSGANGARHQGVDFSLEDIIASLPTFTTTGVATPEAKLQVQTRDHALLKDHYQKIFLQEWELRRNELKKRFSLSSWEARACVGTDELKKITRFGEAGTGGLKVIFTENQGKEKAFIWMRGSKTEPVFRIMADAEGNLELERDLIQWQLSMVSRADSEAIKG
jgi:phosphoglucomutase